MSPPKRGHMLGQRRHTICIAATCVALCAAVYTVADSAGLLVSYSPGQTLAGTHKILPSRSQLKASHRSSAPPLLQGNAELEGPASEEGPDTSFVTFAASCGLGAVVGFLGISRRRALFRTVSSALGVCTLTVQPRGALAEYNKDLVVDLNNSKPGDYRKLPGMFPTISAMIMKYQGQWKEVKELYKLKELDDDQKEIIERYEKNLTVSVYVPINPKDNFIGSRGQ
eukprot:CAMPEP_0172805258 /NCGR_PEP_ID=MMETSP1075-20121228/5669_1 /TAXON_ID=2916 /ORGANISM="Ceratium fusus, Strain PA161109" /LENGTH=225 /DNA_ID=CAMNT_0013643939 /DNA_START=53 /DNA_END=730 /DNA_ORIENTATION=+